MNFGLFSFLSIKKSLKLNKNRKEKYEK